MICAECKQQCNAIEVDFGIGPYEFWGQRGVHINKAWVSSCCEAEMLTDEGKPYEHDPYIPEDDCVYDDQGD